jgi:ankyrin repeat protein
VRCLVQIFGADINQATNGGSTALFYAAEQGNEAVVQCIVGEFGADVNQADDFGKTALFIAAEVGHEAAVRCIVEKLGADVNKCTHDGRTPLMAASYGNHKMVAKYLIKHGADPQAFAPGHVTAAKIAQAMGAPAHLKAYLEAKTHCASPSCGGKGIKKKSGC